MLRKDVYRSFLSLGIGGFSQYLNQIFYFALKDGESLVKEICGEQFSV